MYRQRLAVWAGAAVLVTGGLSFPASAREVPVPAPPSARSVVHDGAGVVVGSVSLVQQGGYVAVRARLALLQPGFHGFHVHGTGSCVAPAFTSAGGHHTVAGKSHGSHGGDLPPLLVLRNGRTDMRFRTDGFTLDELFDADGSAVVVHALADNLGNIPSRYGTPDDTTLNTGDAGARTACGVLQRI